MEAADLSIIEPLEAGTGKKLRGPHRMTARHLEFIESLEGDSAGDIKQILGHGDGRENEDESGD